jgi:hypothetical protein
MHKYLEEIGILSEKLPSNWYPDDERQEIWKCQRKKYGFDEREIWSLDLTYAMWFFERLKMYREYSSNIETIKYKKKKYTHRECIDFILETFEKYIKLEAFSSYNKRALKKMRKAHKLIGIILPTLWY